MRQKRLQILDLLPRRRSFNQSFFGTIRGCFLFLLILYDLPIFVLLAL
jgi:hypothetical protein